MVLCPLCTLSLYPCARSAHHPIQYYCVKLCDWIVSGFRHILQTSSQDSLNPPGHRSSSLCSGRQSVHHSSLSGHLNAAFVNLNKHGIIDTMRWCGGDDDDVAHHYQLRHHPWRCTQFQLCQFPILSYVQLKCRVRMAEKTLKRVRGKISLDVKPPLGRAYRSWWAEVWPRIHSQRCHWIKCSPGRINWLWISRSSCSSDSLPIVSVSSSGQCSFAQPTR